MSESAPCRNCGRPASEHARMRDEQHHVLDPKAEVLVCRNATYQPLPALLHEPLEPKDGRDA